MGRILDLWFKRYRNTLNKFKIYNKIDLQDNAF